MYFSLTETKQLGQNRYYKSSTLKDPYIKTDVWTANINGKIIKSNMRSIEGEKIIRESKTTAWKLSLNHSYRDESGKVHKQQAYIKTINYWEVVDQFLFAIRDGKKESEIQAGHLAFGFCDGEWFDKKVLKIFPDADLEAVWKLYQRKVKDIEQSIVQEFKASDEFKWWKLNQKLRKEIDRLKKQEEQAKQRQEQKQYKQTYQDTFREYEDARKAFISTTSSPAVTLSQAEATLIEKCYKAMAVQVHPDKGGSVEDMQLLNSLRDRVRKCVGAT